MCELLIRVTDKRNDNCPYADAKCLRAGDVVVIVPDGHEWSAQEMAHPHWRILKLPGLNNLDDLLHPQADPDRANPSYMLHRRHRHLDLSHPDWSEVCLRWLADDARSVPWYTLQIASDDLRAMLADRPYLADPNVLD